MSDEPTDDETLRFSIKMEAMPTDEGKMIASVVVNNDGWPIIKAIEGVMAGLKTSLAESYRQEFPESSDEECEAAALTALFMAINGGNDMETQMFTLLPPGMDGTE